MQDIIKTIDSINSENYEDITKDDLFLLMLKARAIIGWDIENKDAFIEIEHTISRFAITAKFGNNDESYLYTLGVMHPLLKLVENFYNDNAFLFVKDETEEEMNTKLMKGYLFDVICKVQTMRQDNWSYGEDSKKKFLYDGFETVSEGLLSISEEDNTYTFPEDVCQKIKHMDNCVNKEFNVFWNKTKVKYE